LHSARFTVRNSEKPKRFAPALRDLVPWVFDRGVVKEQQQAQVS
jgi:hypothetical protein